MHYSLPACEGSSEATTMSRSKRGLVQKMGKENTKPMGDLDAAVKLSEILRGHYTEQIEIIYRNDTKGK
jgi:hypothetical protein